MKDNRFIELVNLYVDRQISSEEAADLEAEMQANPRRRAIYRQYCQMHRATTLVYESFRPEAGAQTSASEAGEGKIARFDVPSQRRMPWLYYAAGVAAAGAALLMSVSRPSANDAPAKAVVAASPISASAPQVAPVLPKVVAAPAISNGDAATMVAFRREPTPAFEKGTIQSSGHSLFEDGVFDPQAGNAIRSFRNKPTAAQQSEFAAFQFQR